MNYEDFKKYKTIYVSGPQRSGTTYFSQLLSMKLGYKYIDEMEFSVSDFDKLKQLDKENAIVQCPGLSHMITSLAGDSVLIVFMIRDIEDILASQERIKWTGNDSELEKYGLTRGNIAEVKYSFWKKQKMILDITGFPYIEVLYDSLKEESTFVNKKDRLHFGPKQTR